MALIINGLFCAGLIFYYRRIVSDAVVGLTFWLVATACNELFVLNTAAMLGSIKVMMMDIVFGFFLFVAFQRYRFFSMHLRRDHILAAFYGALLYIVLSVILFVIFQRDELMRSINSSRDFIIFVPAFLYFFSFSYSSEESERIINRLLLITFFGGLYVFAMTLKSGDRVVPAAGALLMAFSALTAMAKYYESSNVRYLLLSIFFLVTVLVLRHRSVWIATALGLVFIHFYVKVNVRVFALVLLLPVLIFLSSLIVPATYEKFARIIGESASDLESRESFEESTGGGRVARWEAQIRQKLNWKVWIWGQGHAYDRNVYIEIRPGEKRLSTVSFHNHYLEQAFRVGIPTVVALLFFVIRFLRRNHTIQKQKRDYILLGLTACVFGTVGYGMMYSYSFLSFLVMGLGYSIISNSNENLYRVPNFQPSRRGKKLALDAWKIDQAGRG